MGRNKGKKPQNMSLWFVSVISGRISNLLYPVTNFSRLAKEVWKQKQRKSTLLSWRPIVKKTVKKRNQLHYIILHLWVLCSSTSGTYTKHSKNGESKSEIFHVQRQANEIKRIFIMLDTGDVILNPNNIVGIANTILLSVLGMVDLKGRGSGPWTWSTVGQF